jgi:hypothetical protein
LTILALASRKVVKEVGSGVNDVRPQLLALLADQGLGLIVMAQRSS